MEESKDVICPRCGKKISEEDKFCSSCGCSVTKLSKAKNYKIIYYDKLKSIGDTISVLSIVLGIIMILDIFPAMASDGPVFELVIAAIVTFLFGSAIKKLFFCIAEMAKNTEKQTELLEKLNEKLDK